MSHEINDQKIFNSFDVDDDLVLTITPRNLGFQYKNYGSLQFKFRTGENGVAVTTKIGVGYSKEPFSQRDFSGDLKRLTYEARLRLDNNFQDVAFKYGLTGNIKRERLKFPFVWRYS